MRKMCVLVAVAAATFSCGKKDDPSSDDKTADKPAAPDFPIADSKPAGKPASPDVPRTPDDSLSPAAKGLATDFPQLASHKAAGGGSTRCEQLINEKTSFSTAAAHKTTNFANASSLWFTNVEKGELVRFYQKIAEHPAIYKLTHCVRNDVPTPRITPLADSKSFRIRANGRAGDTNVRLHGKIREGGVNTEVMRYDANRSIDVEVAK